MKFGGPDALCPFSVEVRTKPSKKTHGFRSFFVKEETLLRREQCITNNEERLRDSLAGKEK